MSVTATHALPSAMSEALGKDFLIFFFKISLPSALPGRRSANIFFIFFNNFLAECPARSALGKYFLIFFRNFFAECLVRAALGKYFFKKKSLPSARVRALGKEANFFYSIFTNTAYKRYI